MTLHFIDSHIPFKKNLKVLQSLNFYQLLCCRTGVGSRIVDKLCSHVGFTPTFSSSMIRSSYVTSKLKRFFSVKALFLDKNVLDAITTDLHKQVKLQTYKGRRHVMGYPSNGQRTRTNAKTKKRVRLLKST